MMMIESEIVRKTNEIADGIMGHTKEKYNRQLTCSEAHDLRIASIKAASNIMQATIIGKVFDNKCFH